MDMRVCHDCREKRGQIYPIDENVADEPPLHYYCRCNIEILTAMLAGTATTRGEEGADYYIAYHGHLPDYYITKEDARINYGYIPGKNTVAGKMPGKMIGGNIYENDNFHLPSEPGRIWYEADINYVSGRRNTERIVYSNDGLIFVTYDHYETFIEIIVLSEEEEEKI